MPGGTTPDPAGVDEQFVAFAAFHHFCVSCYDLHAGFAPPRVYAWSGRYAAGRLGAEPSSSINPAVRYKRTGTATSQIVNGPVDRQITDIASGKEDRVYHEGVGRVGQCALLPYEKTRIRHDPAPIMGSGMPDKILWLISWCVMRPPPPCASQHTVCSR